MGSVNVPSRAVVNGADVLTPGLPCSTCDFLIADASFQSVFSSPKTPNGPGYTVLYTGGTAWLASVTSGFHRTGLPFEAGTYAQFPTDISPTQPDKQSYTFGQIYDQNDGTLYVIDDFDRTPLESPPTEMTPEQARDAGYINTDLLLRYPILNQAKKVVKGTLKKIMDMLRKLRPWMKGHPWAVIGLIVVALAILTLIGCGAVFCVFRIEGWWSGVQVTDSPFDENDSRWPTCMTYKMPDGSVWHMEDSEGNMKKVGGPTIEPPGQMALKVGLAVGGAFILAGIGVAASRYKPKGGGP